MNQRCGRWAQHDSAYRQVGNPQRSGVSRGLLCRLGRRRRQIGCPARYGCQRHFCRRRCGFLGQQRDKSEMSAARTGELSTPLGTYRGNPLQGRITKTGGDAASKLVHAVACERRHIRTVPSFVSGLDFAYPAGHSLAEKAVGILTARMQQSVLGWNDRHRTKREETVSCTEHHKQEGPFDRRGDTTRRKPCARWRQ
jgi:hypothetical protein